MMVARATALQVQDKTGKEHLVVVDETGEIVHEKTGTERSVEFTPEMQHRWMRDDIADTLVHNHPNMSSLSTADIMSTALPGVDTIEAIGKDGPNHVIFSGRVAGYNFPSDLRQWDKNLVNEMRSNLRDMQLTAGENIALPFEAVSFSSGTSLESERFSKTEAHTVYSHLINESLRKVGVIEYGYEDPQGTLKDMMSRGERYMNMDFDSVTDAMAESVKETDSYTFWREDWASAALQGQAVEKQDIAPITRIVDPPILELSNEEEVLNWLHELEDMPDFEYKDQLILEVQRRLRRFMKHSANFAKKYNPTQPRHPKGHPEGGQWKPASMTSAERNSAMLDELWEKSQPHPFDPKMRLMNVLPEHRDDLVSIEAYEFDGGVHLSSIMTFSPKGKGSGTRALKMFTDMADKWGVTLNATVSPIANAGDATNPSLNLEQLHKWYAKHGFKRGWPGNEREGGDQIFRLPKVKKSDLLNWATVKFGTLVAKYDDNQPRHPKGHPHGGQWRASATNAQRAEQKKKTKEELEREHYEKVVRDKANEVVWYHGTKSDMDIDNLDPNRVIFLSESAQYANYYAAGEATGSPFSFNAERHTPLPDWDEATRNAALSEAWDRAADLGLTDDEVIRYNELHGVADRAAQLTELLESAGLDPTTWEPPGDSGRAKEMKDDLLRWADVKDEYESYGQKMDVWRDAQHAAMAVGSTPWGRPKVFPVKVKIEKPYLTTSEDWLIGVIEGIDNASEDETTKRLLDQGYDSIAWTPSVSEGDMDGFDEFGTMQGYSYGSELVIIDPEKIKQIKSVYRKGDLPPYMTKAEIFWKYDPDQPRHGKGHPEGGRWKSTSVKGKLGDPIPVGSSNVDPDKFKEQMTEEHLQSEPQEPQGFDPDQVLKDLNDGQAQFLAENPDMQGIRVDADLDAEQYPKSHFKEMLERLASFREKSMEGFVLEQGEAFDVPSSAPAIDLMTPKECFSNAAQLTAMTWSDDGEYDYVEGFVIDHKLPFPIHHAWIAPKGTNTVVDPTLGWRPGAAYYGVKMDRGYVRKKLVENGYYGLFTDGMGLNDIVMGTDEDFEYK
jgi:hypothetical protein